MMTQDPPSIRSLARSRLLAEVTGDESSAQAWIDALDRVCDGLRLRLTPIVGREGFEALLSRSLALAKRESGWLDSIHLNAEGALVGLRDASSEHEAAEIEAGCVSLVAQIVDLLMSLIGEGLTRRLLGAIWPELPLKKLKKGTEDSEV